MIIIILIVKGNKIYLLTDYDIRLRKTKDFLKTIKFHWQLQLSAFFLDYLFSSFPFSLSKDEKAGNTSPATGLHHADLTSIMNVL
jgi:hypothetical protein